MVKKYALNMFASFLAALAATVVSVASPHYVHSPEVPQELLKKN